MVPRKLDPAQAPISTAVGIMGMLGLTAYSGMVLQCQPKAGETVVVSAASGGVGQIAGQLAKIYGCRVVGIAGVKEKCDFVSGVLGFDACVSHKSATLAEDLKAACPDGIDAYFENVGGQVFTAVLPLLNRQSRISLCGLVSQYSSTNSGDAHDAWMAEGAPVFERQHVQVHRLHVRDFVVRAKSNTRRIYGLGLNRPRKPSEPCWRVAILVRRWSAWGMTPLWTRP
jgi:NADPH-dependent curcumin reductase CurA